MGYSKRYYKTISSTNSFLKENADSLPSPLFLRAGYQSQGKGRESRSWVAEEGKNLLFSLLIKEKEIVSLGGFLSLVASVIIAKELEKLGIAGISIKWPNDIYIRGKKVVGILLEGRLPEFLVIGMGMNVNQTSFVGEYRIPPTSIAMELKKEIDLDSLEEVLEESLYGSLYKGEIKKDSYLSYYKEHDFLKGRKGIAKAIGKEGVIIGVDEDYRLLLQTEKGVLSLVSGEVDIH